MASPNFIPYPDDLSPLFCPCDILDKKESVFQYLSYMYDRTIEMFEYKNLPDTIIPDFLEFYLQCAGTAVIAEYKGNLYSFIARPGGEPDPYYRPTTAIIANPALNLSQTYRIVNHLPPVNTVEWNSHPPCVLMKNDARFNGLSPLYRRYATQLTENDISIRSAQINARQVALISGSTDKEIISAKKYQDDLVAGKLSVVAQQPFLDGLQANNVSPSSSNSIIQLIELQQYLKAAMFNDIGLNANFNMKREYLSSEEIAANTDVLMPLADDMLRCRKEAVEVINATFGTNISVDKNSAWLKKEEEQEVSLQAQEADNPNSPPNSDGGGPDGE